MSQHPILERLAAKLQRKDIPSMKPGDTVRVQVRIKEGDKERIQAFEGTVIARRNGPQGSFTVRKVSFGQGVERIFPLNINDKLAGGDGRLFEGMMNPDKLHPAATRVKAAPKIVA